MKARFRLLPTVLVCLAALVTVSAGSILALHLITTRTVVSDLIVRTVRQNLRGLELALRGHLDPARYEAEYIANGIASGELSFGDRARLAEFAAGSIAAVPQITGLVISSADGSTLGVSRGPSGQISKNWLNPAANAQRAQRIRQGQARKSAFWGRPIYVKQFNQTVLTLNAPIWRDDSFIGLVRVGISTRVLSQLAIDLSNPPRSTVFVLYGRDRVLAHESLAEPAAGLSAEEPLPSTTEFNDPVIAGFGNAKPLRQTGGVSLKGVKALRLDVDRTRYLAITKSVSGYGNAPLIIGAYSVAAEVNTPFRTMIRAAAVGLGLLVGALLLSVFLSRMIARPIRRTASGTAAIAALDFDNVALLPPSRIKEVDDLANSFNAMLVGLRSFARYVPRTLVNRLIRDNKVGAGTEQRDLTVMFTDIADFTSACEGRSPAEVAEFINHHLALVSECIEREGGTIDKYIGDAVMAFWGAPDSVDDAPVRAARAAIAIRYAIDADNDERIAAGFAPVRIRIGIHSGPLIVGDIGAPNRINYTVVGDVVNAAQRLEALGKEVGPDAESIVLLSDTTRSGLGDQFTVIHAGRFKVKGRREELDVFRLLCELDPGVEVVLQ